MIPILKIGMLIVYIIKELRAKTGVSHNIRKCNARMQMDQFDQTVKDGQCTEPLFEPGSLDQ